MTNAHCGWGPYVGLATFPLGVGRSGITRKYARDRKAETSPHHFGPMVRAGVAAERPYAESQPDMGNQKKKNPKKKKTGPNKTHGTKLITPGG